MAKFLKSEFYNQTAMKGCNEIRMQLGLTQEEMAMALGVSRSLWALYEVGKRDLPTFAFLALSELLKHVNKPEMTAKSRPNIAHDSPEINKALEYRLRENEYEQLRLAKEIDVAESKYASQIRRAQVIDFLSLQTDESIFKKSAKYLIKKIPSMTDSVLAELYLKQELLQHEEVKLHTKFNK